MAKLPNLKGTHNNVKPSFNGTEVVITLAKLPNLKGTHNSPSPLNLFV
ncbi:hypothetical protein [Chishuiella sp.]